MLKEQELVLDSQYYEDHQGRCYSILDLVLWVQKKYNHQKISVKLLEHEFGPDGGCSEESDDSPEFVERALKTEDYPIIVYLENSKYTVADGRHRLYKAMSQGKEFISAYVIELESLPGYIRYYPYAEFGPDETGAVELTTET